MNMSRKDLGLLIGALMGAEDWEIHSAQCWNVTGNNGKVAAENRQIIKDSLRLARHYHRLANKVRRELEAVETETKEKM